MQIFMYIIYSLIVFDLVILGMYIFTDTSFNTTNILPLLVFIIAQSLIMKILVIKKYSD